MTRIQKHNGVDWYLDKRTLEDPSGLSIEGYLGFYGNNFFTIIEDLGEGKYQPYLLDKRTNTYHAVSIPHFGLNDLKGQLEKYKELGV